MAQVTVKSQAVIVVTILSNGRMIISSNNDAQSHASQIADAIVKMSGAVMREERRKLAEEAPPT